MMQQDGIEATPRTRGVGRLLQHAASTAKAAARVVADLAMPPLCLACHAPLADHDSLCAACWREITFLRPPLCDRLGIPLPYDIGGTAVSAAAIADPPVYDRARAVAAYDGAMRRLIHDLKFRDRHDARRLLGRWLAEAGGALLADADLLVPVPLYRFRLLVRRFNQSAILAGEVARRSGVATMPDGLVRVRRTASQVGLSREEREANVRGAFVVAPAAAARVVGRRVVLVDDVITTGATVSACARELKRAGAARVDVLALALVADRVTVAV
ncbi:MAG: ComF family protein [Pseudomonadota bacterium]